MSDSLLERAAALYGIDKSQLRPLKGGNSESMVYEFSRQGQDVVLRITPTAADLEAVAAMLEVGTLPRYPRGARIRTRCVTQR